MRWPLGVSVLLLARMAWAGDNCWFEAGERFGVDPWLLYAIATQESALNPTAVNVNRKGTSAESRDVGLMQINSFWFEALADMGISEEQLYDSCTNIHVGAWVLSQKIRIFGNTWNAVGAYNAGTARTQQAERRRQRYAAAVRAIYRRYLERM